jgi:hypothetical protein
MARRLDHFFSDTRVLIGSYLKFYKEDSIIANVETSKKYGLVGQKLEGKYVLEVPIQNNPIPQAIVDAARNARVEIRQVPTLVKK